MSIRLDFNKGTVQQDLARLPELIRKAALEAVDDAASFMIVMAKTYVLVDTGTLQRSIRKHRSHNIVRVLAGGQAYINPKTHKPCTYAAIIEHRYPYMRPAWDTVSTFIEDKIKRKVLEKVER